MRCELTFRSRRTRPADVRSSNSETLSRIRSLADCTIGTLESSIRKQQWISRCLGQDHGHDCKSRIAGLADQGKVAIAGCCRARATRSARSQPWLRRWPAPATSAIVNPPPDCTDQRMTSDPSSAIQNRYPPRGASPCARSLQKRRSSRSPCYMALLRPRAMTHGGPLAGGKSRHPIRERSSQRPRFRPSSRPCRSGNVRSALAHRLQRQLHKKRSYPTSRRIR